MHFSLVLLRASRLYHLIFPFVIIPKSAFNKDRFEFIGIDGILPFISARNLSSPNGNPAGKEHATFQNNNRTSTNHPERGRNQDALGGGEVRRKHPERGRNQDALGGGETARHKRVSPLKSLS